MWQIGYGGESINEGYFKRKEFFIKDTSSINKFIKDFNNTNVYKSIFYYDIQHNKKILYGDFYLDFDADITSNTVFHELKKQVCTTYEQIKKDFGLNDKNICIYFSGSKGFHIMINAYNLGFTPAEKLNEVYKKIALYYKQQANYIDTKIYDDRRLFRIPNSINNKTGLYKVMLSYEQLKKYTYDEICNYASTEHTCLQKQLCNTFIHLQNKEIVLEIVKKIDAIVQVKINKYRRNYNKAYVENCRLSPCIVNMLNDVHGQGERNIITAIIGSSFFQLGCDFEDVYGYVLDWNKEHFTPNLSDIEIYKTLTSVKNRVENQMHYGCTSIIELGYCIPKCVYNDLAGRIDLYETTFGK